LSHPPFAIHQTGDGKGFKKVAGKPNYAKI
jgi:hypothetical protein